MLKQYGESRQSTAVPWPLAVGSLAENDIISAFMCCDNCSFYVVEQGTTPIREPASGALSLIPYTGNAERWLDDLARGFSHYADAPSRARLPLCFLAVVEETLRTKSWAQPDGSAENELRRNALLWARTKILTQVSVPDDDGGHSGDLVGDWIRKVVSMPNRGMRSTVWQYPLPGFTLMLDLVAAALPVEMRARATWRRMLIEITRHMHELMAAQGFDHVTGLVMAANDVLTNHDAFERDGTVSAEAGRQGGDREGGGRRGRGGRREDWLDLLDTEQVLPRDMAETLRALADEAGWIRVHGRYAMVLWLSLMPSLPSLGELGAPTTTGEMVSALMDLNCADVVMMRPEEVDREWCTSL